MASDETAERPEPSPSVGNLEYDRFVIGELNELLKQEDARQIALEKKAALAAALTLAVSAYSVEAAHVLRSSGLLATIVALWLLFCVVCLLVQAYLAIGVSKCSAVKPLQLLGPDVRKQSEGLRLEGYASHLGSTLAAVRQYGEAKARHVDHAQQWAIVASVSSLVVLLLQLVSPP